MMVKNNCDFFQVGPSGFYKCVTQKPLEETIETEVDRKKSVTELPPNRIAFHAYLQSTIKLGIQDAPLISKQVIFFFSYNMSASIYYFFRA